MSCLADRTKYEEPLLRYHEARVEGRPDVAKLEAEALEANLGIAGAFARRVKGRAALEDVESAATMGLVEAMRSWTPAGGASLPTWAKGPMAAKVRQVKEETVGAVRVPSKTLRAAREIQESGEDIDAACAKLGKRPAVVKAAMALRSCELTPELGATSMEERVFEAEMEGALARAAQCWRGDGDPARLVAAAESLARRRAEQSGAAKKTGDPRKAVEHRTLADALWPASAEGRLRVLARLDYALTVAADERALDVACWRRHYVDGEQWTRIGEELGVTRTRVQFRARRAESAIGRALADASSTPDEALVLWARRPVEVLELERLGVVDLSTNPLEVLYAAEDLEVALTEIDCRYSRVWSARAAGHDYAEIAAELGVGRKTVQRWASRADAALRELLGSVGDAVQLELIPATTDAEWQSTSWWSPLSLSSAVRLVRVTRLRAGHRLRRRASSPTRGRSAAIGDQPYDDHLGCPASPGWVGCTGPPDEARAPPRSSSPIAAHAA